MHILVNLVAMAFLFTMNLCLPWVLNFNLSQTRPQISSAAIIGKCFVLHTKSRILLFAVYIYLNVDKLDICSCTRKSLKNLNSVQNTTYAMHVS